MRFVKIKQVLLTSHMCVHHTCQCLINIIKIIQLKCSIITAMAYVFGFGKDATSILYAMRDWKLEDVKRMGGTPSCRALRPYNINNISCSQPGAYCICVVMRYDFQQDVWIVGLDDHRFVKNRFEGLVQHSQLS